MAHQLNGVALITGELLGDDAGFAFDVLTFKALPAVLEKHVLKHLQWLAAVTSFSLIVTLQDWKLL